MSNSEVILAIHDHVHLGLLRVSDLACISVAEHEIHEECPRFGGYLNLSAPQSANLRHASPNRLGFRRYFGQTGHVLHLGEVRSVGNQLLCLTGHLLPLAFNLGCTSPYFALTPRRLRRIQWLWCPNS